MSLEASKVAIVGLGYVGLPLAVEFGKIRPTLGFDINTSRIAALRGGQDSTGEVTAAELAEAAHLEITDDLDTLRTAQIYVVTVPTPIDAHKRPDLSPLIAASKTVGAVLKPGDLVIYESTVYPGATEEDCVPVLEQVSGLTFNRDFCVGYSPERINPGDKTHRLPNIVKVTAGSTPEAAAKVDTLYGEIITAGTHRAESIKVAEAAKVIENTQRDLNIALVNELAQIFHRMDLDTEAVLRAAGTKWNFLPFRPGLVGGHCIGVDPYYLTHKAESLGHHPQVILAGRRINDRMGAYVAGEVVKLMLQRDISVSAQSRVLVLGLTFKENCPDLRNTGVLHLIRELQDYGLNVDVHDPYANPQDALREYDLTLCSDPAQGRYDAVVLAVAHEDYRSQGAATLRAYGRKTHVFYDLKSAFGPEESDMRL
ncbi:nucleotide sugar dehydrogenase [Epibacterium ulvae]|uniref:nucleotide sugar dehydrogenase n=1 Tax=Epibacterium ulvae TaxID=1156985 RepID=UPI002490310C|nr:nucleotide sugar dehydrogenase [Epibacterium ulvae]